MRKILLIAVATFSLIACGCIEGENNESFDREGALEFSLKVVRTYFDNDMEGFISYLADELYSLEGDGPISKDELAPSISAEDHVVDEDYTMYSMEEYTEVYDPRVMDVEEVESEYPGIVSSMESLGWDYGEDDYLFIGWETKSGEEGPLWDDPLSFVVSHESGEWRFKAFSG